jgi:hypothetical protein
LSLKLYASFNSFSKLHFTINVALRLID